MAIAYVNSTDGGTGSAPSLTFAHTTSGTNRFLVVHVLGDSAASNPITGVTYNSVSLTKVQEIRKAGGTRYWISSWVLSNPASGSNNVVISASSGNLFGNIAVTYSGAQQSDTVDSSNTGSDPSASTLTVSTTTSADNCWLIGLFFNNADPDTKTAGANTTIRGNFVSIQGAYTDSNADQTPPGSFSQKVDGTAAGQDWVGIAFSIARGAAVTAAAPKRTQSTFSLLGVG